jgi:hypothetical protein
MAESLLKIRETSIRLLNLVKLQVLCEVDRFEFVFVEAEVD